MSLWTALLGVMPILNRREISPATPESTRVVFFGSTPAGVHIDGDSMLKNPVVWACVQYLTKSIGQLPWRVMRPTGDGRGNTLATTNLVDWLLHKRPNDEMGAMTFRQTLVASALTRGNGYAEIQRDLSDRPIALWPIAADRVTPMRAKLGDQWPVGTLFYRIQNDGLYTDMDAMDIFHLRGFPGPDGVVGLDVVSYAAQTIGWAQAAELFGATFFGEGMNPAGVVEVDGALKPDALTRLKAQFMDLFKGVRKSNRTAFLDKGQKWTRISTPPNDAQFLETMQHQIEAICRFFGVPPHKVQHMLRATFSNIEHQSIEVVVDSIAPWARLLEEEADFKLFGRFNRQGFYTKIFLQGLMRGDAKARGEFYRLMFQTGAFSPNMILELEDINPIGPKGDKHMIQSQFTTLERIGEEPVEEPSALPKPAATEENGDE